MAYPSSPEISLGGSSGLDHLIKNTEFENIQQTKAIETERERTVAYKLQLEERKQQTVELENSTVALDEQTVKLHKQFAFNQENFDSLKHTSTVLRDHEDTLRRKLSTLQTSAEQEYHEQSNALTKYKGIWASYRAKYESKEKVKLLRSKEEHLHTVREQNAQLEKHIQELEQIIYAKKQSHGKTSCLVSRVLQIATLRCETNHHFKSICAERALAGTLRLEIGGLERKVLDAWSLLEKKEIETKQTLQRQVAAEQHDVAAMETDASTINTTSSDSEFHNSPGITTSASSILFPQPHITPNMGTTVDCATHQQQQTSSKITTHSGQQKKASQFLLEMPRLSIPRPRPVTNTSPANSRALQVLSVLSTRPSSQQEVASSQFLANTHPRRVAQLTMPSLHTPLRQRLLTTSTSRSTSVSTITHNPSTALAATFKPASLQLRPSTQVELPRPTSIQETKGNTTHALPESNVQLKLPQLEQVGAPACDEAGNESVFQQDGPSDSDSNTTAINTSQEMQAIEKNSASEMPQDSPSVPSISGGGEGLKGDQHTKEGSGDSEESSVFKAADVQILQPLPLTTPTQQDATASAMEMTDPPITTYTDPTFSNLNSTTQAMDTTNSSVNQQDPSAFGNVYSVYGGHMYEQPDQQMQMGNTSSLSEQYFDGGMNAFGQADSFGGGGGIFGDTGSSSAFDGGSFFGCPSTPQQQSESGGFAFGFSFEGSSTPSSSSGSLFNIF